jgi:hypothetical protein
MHGKQSSNCLAFMQAELLPPHVHCFAQLMSAGHLVCQRQHPPVSFTVVGALKMTKHMG